MAHRACPRPTGSRQGDIRLVAVENDALLRGASLYIHIPAQRHRKIDKKTVKGYLVGYDGDERYRVWIKEEKKSFYQEM